ncbi:PREDICTED: granzyme A-like [Nanorana parkeri]|uniref:granzyme A-like n=1 Tax=Nanorana parkeri TaxID=125878 RepID=UPI000853FF44|nr:PREDICTED: granzyme A-like [Nanorana parkeri]
MSHQAKDNLVLGDSLSVALTSGSCITSVTSLCAYKSRVLAPVFFCTHWALKPWSKARNMCMDIIGGREAMPHSRPYMVFIRTAERGICGGTLITSNWVLTAAHCSVSNAKVILGAHSIRNYEVEKQRRAVLHAFPHELYNANTFDYDIQLLQLTENAQLGKYVNVLPLPKKEKFPKPGSVCETAGWGYTSNIYNKLSDKLMEVNVTVMKRRACANIWQLKGQESKNITRNMICTKEKTNKGTCGGDSGGPLICNGTVRGVASFGDFECGVPGDASVYSYLNRHIKSWIKKKI